LRISKLSVIAMLFGTLLSHAATITEFTPTSGAITASVYTDFSTFSQFDVRGLAVGFVGGNPSILTDVTGGTDPGFGTLPFGNLTLLATNGIDSAQLLFDSSSALLSADLLTFSMDATGSLVTANGSLGELVGLLHGNFTLTSNVEFGAGALLQYNLDSLTKDVSDVPEPASVGLMFGALPIFLWAARRRARSRS
jgi:hypothetical protein